MAHRRAGAPAEHGQGRHEKSPPQAAQTSHEFPLSIIPYASSKACEKSHVVRSFCRPRGYPATLKNTNDPLYQEWHGKPAIIVGHGGHGGGMQRAAGRSRWR